MVERIGDNRSKAYALAAELWVSTIVAPKTLDDFQILQKDAIAVALGTTDAYLQNHIRFHIGWEEVHRGRMNDAREWARELMQVGAHLNDPRSTGFGLGLLTWIALASDSHAEALENSEQSLAVAVTPIDRLSAISAKGSALILLGRIDEGVPLLKELRERCTADGCLYFLNTADVLNGLVEILQGNIGKGIRLIEDVISRLDKAGDRFGADWTRRNLAEVYLQIIMGKEKPPLSVVLKNLPILLTVMVTASSRIRALIAHSLENPRFDPAGFHIGQAKMMLGLLYKAKKKRALAVQHLTEAKRIFSQFGQIPILGRVETALAELGQ